MRISSLVRRACVLAVLVALMATAAAIGYTASAKAFPVRVCSPTGCATVCRNVLPNGNVVDSAEGTQITVTNPSGETTKYTCKNGEWVAAARVSPTFLLGIFVGLINGGQVTVGCVTRECQLGGTFDLRNGWMTQSVLTG